ncbi:hypothetical protein LIER_14852 [Lithospermum erythrorhizon]|uniref:Uncharacterized protein n=1 Tax=Lithospermum erythrorhizon TaxID=34254 RepID=A0AAV3Q588_LITER
MSFSDRLRYGKLKKALLIRISLSKDELTAAVTTHIELEELKTWVEQLLDLRETVLRKKINVSPRKPSVWEMIQRDRDNSRGSLTRVLFLKGEWFDVTNKQAHVNLQENGHDTNECRILRTHIETLIQREYLKEFTRDKGQERPQGRGGIYGGGDSRNSRKKYARKEVFALANTLCNTEQYHRAYTHSPDRIHRSLRVSSRSGIMVDIPDSSYNVLIGRPILTAIKAIVSPVHIKHKFPTAGGIGEMSGDQKCVCVCYQASIPSANPGRKSGVEAQTEE